MKTVCSSGEPMIISLPQRSDDEMQLVTHSFSDLLYPGEKKDGAAKLHEGNVKEASEQLALYDAEKRPRICFRVLSKSLGT